MKVYKTQEEVEKDIKNGRLCIDDDVKFECDINIDANITAGNIDALNITALDITAMDINANDITYYAFCNVYWGITCDSIKGHRNPHVDPVCLDGKLTIRDSKKTELLKKADELIAKAEETSKELISKANELKKQAEGA